MTMEINDIVSILFGVIDDINHQWNVYYVGLLAFCGWIISRKAPINLSIKTIMTICAGLFMIVHLWTLSVYYELLDIYSQEFLELIKKEDFSLSETKTRILEKGDVSSKWISIYWLFHLTIDAIIFTAIWSDRIWLDSVSKT